MYMLVTVMDSIAEDQPPAPWPCSYVQFSWMQVVKIFCERYQQLDQAGKQELLLSMARYGSPQKARVYTGVAHAFLEG